MHVPYRLAVELPQWTGRARTLRLSRRLCVATLVGLCALGLAVAVGLRHSSPPPDTVGSTPLSVTSQPPGAEVRLDGRPVGRTPLTLLTTPGAHTIALHHSGFLDVERSLDVAADGAALDQRLWRSDPIVQRLRPIYPGATIATADFLADGRILLGLALPGADRAVWTLDPTTGAVGQIASADSRITALAPDGQAVATLERPPTRLDRLSLGTLSGPAATERWRLPAGATDEQLTDATWAPDGAHLLLVGRQTTPTGVARSTLRWLPAAAGEPVPLATLPAEVVPGSFSWSPDGTRVAFLARTAQATALCVVGGDGSFRYLADIARGTNQPLTFPPIAWAPGGDRLAFTAPSVDQAPPSLWPFSQKPQPTLYTADLAGGAPRSLSPGAGSAPAWGSDGLLTLAPSEKGDGIAVRSVDEAGQVRELTTLAIRPGSALAARWDLAHDQLIVQTLAGSTAAPEYWLVRFGAQEGE